ncbi:MAG: phosphoglycerate mutase [Thermoleophilia bacterium]|nr:phosphoglycerate mutase [Thermoleophilia bacterium]
MPPSDLYLIRHAQSTWNAAGRWQGQADPPLSADGVEQARALAADFPDVDVARMLVSDLTRARETAEPFAARFGLELEISQDLREIDVGSWSGRTREEIEAAEPGALERYYLGESGWTGGETFGEHEVRCATTAERISSLPTDGVVVVVTHGGTLRAILRTLLEIPHEERWRISGPSHTTLTHLRRSDYGWRLVSFNAGLDVGHA